MVEYDVLTHELQLGEQLNHCVHQSRRADFALMLAMLTDDVRAQSQFLLPKTELQKKTTSDEQLRTEFDLPNPQSMALDSLDAIDCFNQSSHVNQALMATIQLENAIAPRPLSFRNDKKHIPAVVKSNTSLSCQLRQEEGNEREKLSLDAKGWLKSIKNSLLNEEVKQANLQLA
ncbi:VC2046/SO_2500 family protein [Thalassotalea algicola]|uniref:VC2046/SO_2500 family protein n=1 Tax=Thalassotalea algicola TaxID=2716224 RepID=UPI001B7D6CB9|nr:VC2046/SO_2500 family protein [Thalassotalea algicola]